MNLSHNLKHAPKNLRNKEWAKVYPYPWLFLPDTKDIAKTSFAPHPNDIFETFNYHGPLETKAVFLFLSPYPDIKAANGIATGIKEGGGIRPSFKVLMKALANDYPEMDLNSVDTTLKSWVKQGVLMLNAALTVPLDGSKDAARAHLDYWKIFISSILYSISNPIDDVVFILCGKDAHKYEKYISFYDNPVLKVPHPAATYYWLKKNKFDWDNVPDHLDFTNKEVFKAIDWCVANNKGDKIKWNETI